MRSTLKTLLIWMLLATAGLAGAVQTGPVAGIGNAATLPDLATYQDDGLTLSQAVEQVRRQYNGRIVSAETQMNGDREVHVIKVLTADGKVKTVRVPGRRRN